MREVVVFLLFCLSAVLVAVGVGLVSVPAAVVVSGIGLAVLTFVGAGLGSD